MEEPLQPGCGVAAGFGDFARTRSFWQARNIKGIGLFCDALDLIKGANLPLFSVTFLGRDGRVAGRDAVSYIRARAEHWGFPYRIVTDRGREAALQFLSEDVRRIAIIPSFEDNLPNTVIECLAGRIPFLASRASEEFPSLSPIPTWNR